MTLSDFIEQAGLLLGMGGNIIRFVGSLIIGIVIGWFTNRILSTAEKAWQLQIAVYLGLLGTIASLTILATGGAVGAIGIGIGVGVFLPAVLALTQKSNEKK